GSVHDSPLAPSGRRVSILIDRRIGRAACMRLVLYNDVIRAAFRNVRGCVQDNGGLVARLRAEHLLPEKDPKCPYGRVWQPCWPPVLLQLPAPATCMRQPRWIIILSRSAISLRKIPKSWARWQSAAMPRSAATASGSRWRPAIRALRSLLAAI